MSIKKAKYNQVSIIKKVKYNQMSINKVKFTTKISKYCQYSK